MTLAIDPCALQFCKPLIPQSKRSNDYLQLLIRSEVPAAEPFSNLHVNKQRQLHGSWPSQTRCRAVGSEFSLQPHAYVQGPAQQCPPGYHRQPANQMGSWALPAGTRRNFQVVTNGYGSHKTWAQSGAGYTMNSSVLL